MHLRSTRREREGGGREREGGERGREREGGRGGGAQVKVRSWYVHVEEENSQTGGCVAMATHW